MAFIHFFGVDVSKNWFDVAIAGVATRPRRFGNTAQGIGPFLATLEDRRDPSFVVLEATGGYEIALIAALIAAGVVPHRAAPWQARSFAHSRGRQAKTDGRDAKALARLRKAHRQRKIQNDRRRRP